MKIFVGGKHVHTLACKPPSGPSGIAALWFVSQTAETDEVNLVSTSIHVGVVRHAEWQGSRLPTFNTKGHAADKASAIYVEVPLLINEANLVAGTELRAIKFNGGTKKRGADPPPASAAAKAKTAKGNAK